MIAPAQVVPALVIPASPFLLQRMAGLSGLARCVILADLEGAGDIWIVAETPPREDWHESFRVRERAVPNVRIARTLDELPADTRARMAMVPPDRLPARDGMRWLLTHPGAAPTPDPVLLLPAETPAAVTRRILAASMKSSEGWVGRNINRPISFRLSAFLMRWNTSPDTVTWFTFLLALVMSVILAGGGALGLAIGGALYQAVSIIDCVDGDIARVTFRTSRRGAALDTTFDMLANLGFVIGVTAGLVRTYGEGELWVALAMVLVAATAMLLMTLLLRLGPRHGSFDVLRAALTVKLAPRPRVMAAVLTGEKLFKRDFYALFAASLCVSGLGWLINDLGLGGVIIWLLAIVWCAPVIAADKRGALLPGHLQAD